MNFLSLFKRKIIYNLKKKINVDKDIIKNDSLDDLFYYYGSDKANIFKLNDNKGHGFSTYYTNKLKIFKNDKVNILEIGSYSGASAVALSKFLPLSKIFCLDINISNFKFKSKNIHVYGLDTSDELSVIRILKKILNKHNVKDFDFIIDDGSHNLKDILINFKLFFKKLKTGGFYVIEDFKYPNYYERNKDIKHIFIDQLLNNLKKKTVSVSNILTKDDQNYLIKNIKFIEIFKGNLQNSDICFIEKK